MLAQFEYFYTDAGVADPTGHLRRERGHLGQVHAYSYDNLYRLTGETHPDLGTVSYGYGTDAQYGLNPLGKNGNRITRTQNGVTEWSGYDAQNKLLWTNQADAEEPTAGQAEPYRKYEYNLNGDPTRITRRAAAGSPVSDLQYEWDGAGKMRRIRDLTASTSLYAAEYEGAGPRLRTATGGVTNESSFGLHESAGNVVHTPGVGEQKNGTAQYFQPDRLGSTRYFTDSAGNSTAAYRFDAFGGQSAAQGAGSTARKFGAQWGYRSDVPGGLQLMGARYYDPEVGRFLSADPIGFAGGLNAYAYCDNDPVNAVDPTGLYTANEFMQAFAEDWDWNRAGGQVLGVAQGYGDAAWDFVKSNNPVYQILTLPDQWHSAMALGELTARCGIGTTLGVMGGAIYQEWAFWDHLDNPRKFGSSFGNWLILAAQEGRARRGDPVVSRRARRSGAATGRSQSRRSGRETRCSLPIPRPASRVTRRSRGRSFTRQRSWCGLRRKTDGASRRRQSTRSGSKRRALSPPSVWPEATDCVSQAGA